jgi:hypothetical protein
MQYICNLIKIARANFCLQEMNMKTNDVGKIWKNESKQYMYSTKIHIFSVALHMQGSLWIALFVEVVLLTQL